MVEAPDRSCRWPPAGMPRPGYAVPDELQPRFRPVGTAGLRPAAARLPRVGPPRARSPVVLLGGGVQGPVRVVQMRAPDRAQVGPAGQQEGVHVVVRADD